MDTDENGSNHAIGNFNLPDFKQVKLGFTNYQPQPKYSWASKIEGKGKLGKTKDLKK